MYLCKFSAYSYYFIGNDKSSEKLFYSNYTQIFYFLEKVKNLCVKILLEELPCSIKPSDFSQVVLNFSGLRMTL